MKRNFLFGSILAATLSVGVGAQTPAGSGGQAGTAGQVRERWSGCDGPGQQPSGGWKMSDDKVTMTGCSTAGHDRHIGLGRRRVEGGQLHPRERDGRHRGRRLDVEPVLVGDRHVGQHGWGRPVEWFRSERRGRQQRVPPAARRACRAPIEQLRSLWWQEGRTADDGEQQGRDHRQDSTKAPRLAPATTARPRRPVRLAAR